MESRYREPAYTENIDIMNVICGPEFTFIDICALVSVYSEVGYSEETDIEKMKHQEFTIVRVRNSGAVSPLNQRRRVG